MKTQSILVCSAASVALLAWLPVRAQDPDSDALGVNHAECALFAPEGERFRSALRERYWAGGRTEEVVARLGASIPAVPGSYFVPGGSRTDGLQQLDQMGTIDGHLFRAMQEAGVTPSARINDYQFARRASLDLTGHVPTYDRLMRFVADTSSGKRARYVDELLNSPEWVDKWSMFFGDLLENLDNNTQVRRYPQGRNAFYNWIRKSVAENKRYNQFVTEMITAQGGNSFEDGSLNWVVGALVTGGPRTGQDNFDQMAAITADKFLGISHENCILCHDGRRHLDTLSVWGKQETRLQSWRLAAFFSQVTTRRTPIMPGSNVAYYSVSDNVRAPNYPLNTATGNRPPREPIGTIANVAPEYPFGDGGAPQSGENYRQALARLLTADIQFARAMVNRVWAQFFVRAIVDPVNQFDPMRLDQASVPEGWTLQPTNPALMDALARDFQESGFDVKALMRQIATSEAYQLSSAFEGQWKPEYEKLFARKFVRRLWAEEVLDNIAQVSNVAQVYRVPGLDDLRWAMQLPDPTQGGALAEFLNAFLRGNRMEDERRGDGSISQVLNLMNDNFVHVRTRASGNGAAASLARQLLNKHAAAANNQALIDEMFLTVLSRPPSASESAAATASLAQGTTAAARQQRVEDLLWSLFNKVDFVYNY